MALIRWNKPEASVWAPFRQLSELRSEIDRLFESPLHALASSSQQFLSGWAPVVDIHEERDHLMLRAELPGVKKEDLDISLHGDVLTISGERREEKEFEQAQVYRSERFLGKFQRSFTLPVSVAADKVDANYRDGVLTVRLPKAEEAKPKQITIKTQ
jgi:HSP20 family protein